MPGVIVKVKWPVGWVRLWEDGNGGVVDCESADPNDHYRPWMEEHVGKQGWDWNWDLLDNDASTNRLTIKVRRSKADLVSVMALMWG